jgi:hypothetical protein
LELRTAAARPRSRCGAVSSPRSSR